MAIIELIGLRPTQKRLRQLTGEAVAAIVAGSRGSLAQEATGSGLRGALQSAVRTHHPGRTEAENAPLEDKEWWEARGPEKHGNGYQLSLRATKTVTDKAGERYNLLGLLMAGTRAHEIEGDPYLSFDAGGEHVTTRGTVQHPGTPADSFIAEAVEQYTPQATEHAMQGATAAVLRLLRGKGGPA